MNSSESLEKSCENITNSLIRVLLLRGLKMDKYTMSTWVDKIQSDISSGLIDNISKGFAELTTYKLYGSSLDYAVFFNACRCQPPDKLAELAKESQ